MEPVGYSQKELRRIVLQTKRLVSSDITGAFRSSFRGTGLTFKELAEYRPGDDPRSIHWGASAKTGRVYVKQYEEERSLRIHGMFDRSLSVRGDTRVLEFATALSLIAERDKDHLTLSCFGDGPLQMTKAAASAKFLPYTLRFLSAHPAIGNETAMGSALYELSKALHRKNIIFVVSDFLAADFSSHLKRLSARHDVILVLLAPRLDFDSQELTLVREPESGQLIELDLGDPRTVNEIKSRFEEHTRLVRTISQECGATFGILTDSPVKCLAQICLRRKGRR